MNWIKRVSLWKDTIGVRESIFDKLLQIGKRVTCLESRIKLLEDNAFSDRAKIGVLENKVEELTNEIIRLKNK